MSNLQCEKTMNIKICHLDLETVPVFNYSLGNTFTWPPVKIHFRPELRFLKYTEKVQKKRTFLSVFVCLYFKWI
jgi:hypothetical protein